MNSHDTKVKLFYVAGILLVGLFTVAAPGLCDEKNVAASIDQLKKATSLPAYAANKLNSIEIELSGFDKNYVITTNEEETLHELVRILKTTKSKYEALNHYVFGWNTTIDYLYRANVETVKRGVAVSRIFIISDDVLSNTDKLKALVKIMEKQSNDGIKVSYGLKRDVEKDPAYHPFALMDVGLSDDAVFAKVTAVSMIEPQPAGMQITWDENIIKKQNPFPYLKKSPYIYPYDAKTLDKLQAHAAQEAKSTNAKERD
jgi:hypothetical protein